MASYLSLITKTNTMINHGVGLKNIELTPQFIVVLTLKKRQITASAV